jgi:hypothetical protein
MDLCPKRHGKYAYGIENKRHKIPSQGKEKKEEGIKYSGASLLGSKSQIPNPKVQKQNNV